LIESWHACHPTLRFCRGVPDLFIPVAAGTLYAAILRSPFAYAEIASIDTARARALPGVACILTGEDVAAATRPFPVAVTTAMKQWSLAVGRVRHTGEPVAIAAADTRHQAEDALEAIAVDYRALPAAINPQAAAAPDAPLLHPAVGSNVVHDRRFRYGDPEAAFAAAPRRISIATEYPRDAGAPIECFVVVAEYLRGEGIYEITANFQGPLAMPSHPRSAAPGAASSPWPSRHG
jgi:2-furoyl-CoA dehydrogenase large subunit